MGGIMQMQFVYKPAAATPPAGIVLTGLQFDLSSAPAAGSTWSDTSGNGRNATLNGNTAYVSTTGGGIKLQNADSAGTAYISVPYNFTGNTTTVEVVASFNPTSFWATIFGNEIYNSSSGYMAYLVNSTTLAHGTPAAGATYTMTANNNIRHWVFVFNGNNAKIYLNGTQVSNNVITAQTSFPTNSLLFGARHMNAGTGVTDKMNSSTAANQPVFYQMRAYNKSLTAAEVTQNYTAIRSTYSI